MDIAPLDSKNRLRRNGSLSLSKYFAWLVISSASSTTMR